MCVHGLFNGTRSSGRVEVNASQCFGWVDFWSNFFFVLFGLVLPLLWCNDNNLSIFFCVFWRPPLASGLTAYRSIRIVFFFDGFFFVACRGSNIVCGVVLRNHRGAYSHFELRWSFEKATIKVNAITVILNDEHRIIWITRKRHLIQLIISGLLSGRDHSGPYLGEWLDVWKSEEVINTGLLFRSKWSCLLLVIFLCCLPVSSLPRCPFFPSLSLSLLILLSLPFAVRMTPNRSKSNKWNEILF